MARSNRSRFPSRSNARHVSWSPGPRGVLGTISSSTQALFPVSAEASLDDLTIVRTRGLLTVQLISTAASLQGFEYGFGICVVTQNAAGIGITAVPDPLADQAWDGWFVYETGNMLSRAAISGGDDDSPTANLVIEIDSKAMRKTHLTDTIVAVISTLEVGTSIMQVSLATRILAKLP